MIGEYFPDTNSFVKNVRVAEHLFKKFDAWGMDAKFFTEVLLPKNSKIIIRDDDLKVYRTDAKTFKKYGMHLHFKDEKEDYGSQIFLARHRFNQDG